VNRIKTEIEYWIGYVEREIDIREIQFDIWPSWHLDDWNGRDNNGYDNPEPMLEIPSLIATFPTLYFVIIEDIEEDLPEIEEFCDEYKCFYPTSKSESIIIEPSAHEVLNCLNILNYAKKKFFLEIKKSLKSLRKFEIRFHCLYI